MNFENEILQIEELEPREAPSAYWQMVVPLE